MRKLPKYWIEHIPDWRGAPMAYWVHVQPEGEHWQGASEFSPPAPAPDGAKGYPLLCVETQGFVFVFSSVAQLAEAIRVLSLKPLPTSRRLAAARQAATGRTVIGSAAYQRPSSHLRLASGP